MVCLPCPIGHLLRPFREPGPSGGALRFDSLLVIGTRLRRACGMQPVPCAEGVCGRTGILSVRAMMEEVLDKEHLLLPNET